MKNLFFLLIVLAAVTVTFGKNIQKTGEIIVEIDGIIDNQGTIRSQLFRNSEYFPTKSNKAFRRIQGKIDHKKSEIVYHNIPFGEYAVAVHHDEDNNGLMNRNFIGYPTEGYGLSNNPTIIFKLPSFDECKFKLNSNSKIIHIKMKN